MASKKATKATPSTQRYLQISEIKDDTIIMKDGSLRAVLLVSSVNFALKSEDEQNAIISGYVSFLNSLESPLQIMIQSRKLDLDQYLEFLKTEILFQVRQVFPAWKVQSLLIKLIFNICLIPKL